MDISFTHVLFLIPLITIGIICAYTDIRYNKILNQWILLGLLIAFFLYLYLWIYKDAGQYVVELIINGAISFIIGYLLWHFKLWSAGDAKLFTVFALLIPFDFYSKNFIYFFPSFNLMINLFIPLFMVLAILAIISTVKEAFVTRKKIINLLKVPDYKQVIKLAHSILQIFLSYFFAIVLLRITILAFDIFFKAGILLNPFFIFAVLFLTINTFIKKRKKSKCLNLIIYGIIIVYFFILAYLRLYHQISDVFITTFVFMTLIESVRLIMNSYVENKQTLLIPPEKIKEGMVPAGEKFRTFFQDINENEDFGVCDAGGFNKKQATKIKLLPKKCPPIKIYKTFPFAPFMLFAAFISIWTQSSFLNILQEIFTFF